MEQKMSRKFVLAHDLGTTGNKACLFDEQGKPAASVSIDYGVSYPQPGWAEQDPQDWWQAVCDGSRRLLAEAHVQPDEIACVSFSGQMMGCVAVDPQARPLRSAMIWADQRAEAQAQMLIERVGWERMYALTGHRAGASYSGAKILWLRDHQPEIFKATHKFLQAKDFIAARLTGRFVTDYSDASGTNLYDLNNWNWSAEILEAVGLDVGRLPELHASSDVIGEVTRAAAEACGLKAGTPVMIGGGDGCCASTGAGVIREGRAYNYIGSSSWIALATRRPVLDPAMRTFTFAHLVPGMYCPCGTMQTAGGAYQWLRDVFGQAEKEAGARLGISPYELLDLEAESSPPGARGLLFLPYLLGERSPHWNPLARGAYLGLTVRHTRADIIRATLEGITFNLRMILDAFREQSVPVEAMRVIGGGARGRLWRQIMADIYRLAVTAPALPEAATSLGAAIAGGVGVGLYPDYSIAEALTPTVDALQPNAQAHARYARQYQVFVRAYSATARVSAELAELQAE
jgi:xylulokinase